MARFLPNSLRNFQPHFLIKICYSRAFRFLWDRHNVLNSNLSILFLKFLPCKSEGQNFIVKRLKFLNEIKHCSDWFALQLKEITSSYCYFLIKYLHNRMEFFVYKIKFIVFRVWLIKLYELQVNLFVYRINVDIKLDLCIKSLWIIFQGLER